MTPKREGHARLRGARRRRRGGIFPRQSRPCHRGAASVNVPSFLLPDRARRSMCRTSGRSSSTSPMAAISTPSSSRRRPIRDLDDISAFDIQRLSPIVRRLINEKYELRPPREPDHHRHSATSSGPASRITRRLTRRNAVFYGEKAIDRSPCGTGTSARHGPARRPRRAQGRRRLRPRIDHRQPVPRPRRERRRKVGDYDAIVPSVAGQAWITGHNTIFLDDRDPFVKGFSVL